MGMGKGRRIKGVLERAADGEGIICPHCKTLAVKGRGDVYRCPACRREITRTPLKK